MGDVIKLESKSPMSWTVEDALQRALDKIKSGEYDAEMVYVALCRNPKDGDKSGKIWYTMAGMQLPEAIGWLTLHRHVLLTDGD